MRSRLILSITTSGHSWESHVWCKCQRERKILLLIHWFWNPFWKDCYLRSQTPIYWRYSMELIWTSCGYKEILAFMSSICSIQVKLPEFSNFQASASPTYYSTTVMWLLISNTNWLIGEFVPLKMSCWIMPARILTTCFTSMTWWEKPWSKRVYNPLEIEVHK